MNKYQEALNNIVKSCCPNCDTDGCKDCTLEKTCNATAKKWVDTLQELVDKAEPTNPPLIWDHANPKNRCSCSSGVIPAHSYCWNCGQKLDWSE